MMMKIKIIKNIRGNHIVPDLKFSTIKPGIYDVDHMNPQGAISVKSEDGKRVGVKLDEFEFLSEMDRYYWIKIAHPNIPSVMKTVIKEPKPISICTHPDKDNHVGCPLLIPLKCDDCSHERFLKGKEVDNTKNIDQWIVGRNTGISSQTLWAAMRGIEPCENTRLDIPYDPDDFSRCYELMKLATPEQIKKALDNVGIICPKWIPFAREWDELVELYEYAKSIRNYSEMYGRMKELEKESNDI